MRVLHLSEDEERVERTDAVKVAEDAKHEFLVSLHVGKVNHEHEAVVATPA